MRILALHLQRLEVKHNKEVLVIPTNVYAVELNKFCSLIHSSWISEVLYVHCMYTWKPRGQF